MRAFMKVALLSFGLPALCGLGFAALYVAAAYLAVLQLPGPLQGPALERLFGPAGSAKMPALSVSGAPEGGYAGPESFLCLLPPTAGYLTDPYGTVRPGGWVHYGIDYGSYRQPVPVRTPFGGLIVFTGWAGSFGNLVIVENGGYRVYLAHLSEILAAAGAAVTAGETVGISGETGSATGVHVHFEVRVWNGSIWTPVDPGAVVLPGQGAACDWTSLAAPLD